MDSSFLSIYVVGGPRAWGVSGRDLNWSAGIRTCGVVDKYIHANGVGRYQDALSEGSTCLGVSRDAREEDCLFRQCCLYHK